MADVYNTIMALDPAIAEKLGDAMELRATDVRQQEMLAAYLDDLALPGNARILEVGCGTGAIARALAQRPGVGEVVGGRPVARVPGASAHARGGSDQRLLSRRRWP
jgi:SAM-dependent methyltransferase